jgi:tetratricopeptide (TPR) repeat protein
MRAQIALSQGSFPQAKDLAAKVLQRSGTEFKGVASDARLVVALAQSYGGSSAAGKKTALEALEVARELNDPAQLANAQLTLAEAMLLAQDSQGALNNALQAEEVFARFTQQASHWHALTIAALASQNIGDKTRAREYAMRARDLLSKLDQRWDADSYHSYLNRPDIDRLRKQLEHVTGSPS